MIKENDLKSIRGLILRNRQPPKKEDVFQACLVNFLRYLAGGLLMGAAVFLYSLLEAGERQLFARWMSGSLVIIFGGVGLLRASSIALGHWILRWKNPDRKNRD